VTAFVLPGPPPRPRPRPAEPRPGPLTRRLEPGYQDDPPIAGRLKPHEIPEPGFVHHVIFDAWSMPTQVSAQTWIQAHCNCGRGNSLDNGHDLADLITWYAQHAGLEAAKRLCIDTLARYAAEHDVTP
jgi:hypothetical protein